MNKLEVIKEIKRIFDGGQNVMSYLRKNGVNSTEDIQISYDLQAGEYVKYYHNNPEEFKMKSKKVASIFENLSCTIDSVFEAGVGEGTMLVPIINNLKYKPNWVGGVDLSWSRIKTAIMFASKELEKDIDLNLFMGDMFCLPISNDSVDLVYTIHAIEPNGGREKEILRELFRITNKYLVLIEPSYELASEEGKERMVKNGYARDLRRHCKELGYNIIGVEPFSIDNEPLNPAEVIIIRKDTNKTFEDYNRIICCPATKERLSKYEGFWYSSDSMLAYPIIHGVSCLNIENAVVCTKMIDFIKR